MLELLTGTGLAVAAGLNAYVPLLVLGLAGRFLDFVELPSAWRWLENEWVLLIIGVLLVIELVADKKTKAKFDPVGKVALYLFERAQEHGLIVRAIQDNIAFCPPLIVTPEQIDQIVARFGAALEETEAWVAAGMPTV